MMNLFNSLRRQFEHYVNYQHWESILHCATVLILFIFHISIHQSTVWEDLECAMVSLALLLNTLPCPPFGISTFIFRFLFNYNVLFIFKSCKLYLDLISKT